MKSITMTIAAEEKLGEVSEDMRNLDGVDSDMLRKLAEAGVTQRDDPLRVKMELGRAVQLGVGRKQGFQVMH